MAPCEHPHLGAQGGWGQAGIAQIGECAGVLHAILIQLAALRLPCAHHALCQTRMAGSSYTSSWGCFILTTVRTLCLFPHSAYDI